MMGRPPLWCCESCGRPLGRIIGGDLDVFGPSKAKPGHTEVPCLCGKSRIWYPERECESTRRAEFARRP